MKATTASWRLHRNAIIVPLRATLLASTVAFALSVRVISLTDSTIMYLHIFLITTLYVAGLFLIIRGYLKDGGPRRSILVDGGALSIPRFILKRQFVHFHEIKSIEKYFDSVKIIAVLIGRSNKSSILIERRNFNSGDQFEEFVQFLAQFALKNHAKEAAADIAVVTARREAKGSSFMALIALSLFGTYVVLAAPGLETISESAIVRGGLIKESLLIDQFYRFASSFFLHYTPFHLGLNIVSLAIVGQYVDVILGRVRFINVLLCSAILGSLLSLAFSPYAAVIGASGGILGLLGAYFLVCIKYQRQLPGSVSVSGRVILLVLVLQILGDVATEGGDIFSHIGGFVFGFLYAGLALHRRSVVKAAIASSAERCIAAGVALAYGGGLIYFLGLFFAFL